MRHPTILDVAERAGVSKSLVSLVMRGSPRVSEARRKAVLEAAEALGYRPNAVARSLVRKRSGVFGCVISDLHNPFFADVADGIEEGATVHGYRALLSSGFLDASREAAAIETLLQLRVDGLLMIGTLTSMKDLERAAASVPIVVVAAAMRSEIVDSVANDDVAGAAAVVDHLVELGHRRIAHIHGGNAAAARARRRGYERAMTRAGIEEHIESVRGAFTEAGGREAMAQILDRRNRRPTAVFVANDYAALGTLAAIADAGLDVPGDISIAGYDNISIVRSRTVSLTTVEQPSAAMGQMAVEMLLERLNDERTTARHVVMPPQLVVRTSTGPPK